MGNIWSSLYVSKNKYIKDNINNKNSCNDAIIESKHTIDNVINIIKHTKKWNNTKDFKTYGLYPGQEIFYRNIANNYNKTHPAIYLYNGLIIEIASGPKSCIKEVNFFNSFLGISSLEEYIKYGKNKRKSDIWKVEYGNKTSNNNYMINVLKRTKKCIGPINFNLLNNNCNHITNNIIYNHDIKPYNLYITKYI